MPCLGRSASPPLRPPIPKLLNVAQCCSMLRPLCRCATLALPAAQQHTAPSRPSQPSCAPPTDGRDGREAEPQHLVDCCHPAPNLCHLVDLADLAPPQGGVKIGGKMGLSMPSPLAASRDGEAPDTPRVPLGTFEPIFVSLPLYKYNALAFATLKGAEGLRLIAWTDPLTCQLLRALLLAIRCFRESLSARFALARLARAILLPWPGSLATPAPAPLPLRLPAPQQPRIAVRRLRRLRSHPPFRPRTAPRPQSHHLEGRRGQRTSTAPLRLWTCGYSATPITGRPPVPAWPASGTHPFSILGIATSSECLHTSSHKARISIRLRPPKGPGT